MSIEINAEGADGAIQVREDGENFRIVTWEGTEGTAMPVVFTMAEMESFAKQLAGVVAICKLIRNQELAEITTDGEIA